MIPLGNITVYEATARLMFSTETVVHHRALAVWREVCVDYEKAPIFWAVESMMVRQFEWEFMP